MEEDLERAANLKMQENPEATEKLKEFQGMLKTRLKESIMKNPSLFFHMQNSLRQTESRSLELDSRPQLSVLLIEAVTKYNKEEHKSVIQAWAKNVNNLKSVDSEGNTIIYYAALAGRVSLIDWFAKKGVDLDAQNKIGNSVLFEMLDKLTYYKGETRQKIISSIKTLINSGAAIVNIHPEFKLEKNAIDSARSSDCQEILEMLERKRNTL